MSSESDSKIVDKFEAAIAAAAPSQPASDWHSTAHRSGQP
jgi:hypothetical protein